MRWLGCIVVVLLATVAAFNPFPSTRTMRTHCIAVEAPNAVTRFDCSVTLPPRVRLTRGSLIYVEVKR